MRGIPNGQGIAGASVPTRFNLDSRIEKTDKVVLLLPDTQKAVIAGIYVRGMSQRDLAGKLSISRGKLQHALNKSYASVYNGLIHP
jgi:DNA-directed RNA polymerase specialized sigma24 family protein